MAAFAPDLATDLYLGELLHDIANLPQLFMTIAE